jgi:perosamine synthetase
MINLFHINNYNIDTSTLGNLLHGPIVTEFEENFASYVGAKYACSANSASSLLFLSLLKYNTTIRIPSTMPIVVPNIIVNTGNKIEFYDDVDWVGSYYNLHDNIFDSAQQVSRNQYTDLGDDGAVMVFSFYPTKPVGGCDGGMVVSNNKETIEWYRTMTLNGVSFDEDNWNRVQRVAGYKMHSTSIQAYIANENLKRLDAKNERLEQISKIYNNHFGLSHTSKHLYRINVRDNRAFLENMKSVGISCGIHYEHCHDKKFYNWTGGVLPLSEAESITTASLPFHEMLTDTDIETVIQETEKFRYVE